MVPDAMLNWLFNMPYKPSIIWAKFQIILNILKTFIHIQYLLFSLQLHKQNEMC